MGNDTPLFPPSLSSAAWTPMPIMPQHAAQQAACKEPVSPMNSLLAPQTGFTTQNLLDYTFRAQAGFSPVAACFTPNGGNQVDYNAILNTPLPPEAQKLYDAILAFPDSKASANDAHIIALTTHYAARDFKVDPQLMLAIFAHESGGFDTSAKSHTGAGGLGQLTDSAINETRRLSYDETYDGPGNIDHYPRADIRSQLEREDVRNVFRRVDSSKAARNDIHDNVWTSTAYARIMMDRATKKGNVSVTGTNGMLERYNSAGGTEQANFPGNVGAAYKKLWGAKMPTTLPNPKP